MFFFLFFLETGEARGGASLVFVFLTGVAPLLRPPTAGLDSGNNIYIYNMKYSTYCKDFFFTKSEP